MKCILCNTEIEEGMKACPKCGSSFGIPQTDDKPVTPQEEVKVEEAPVQEEVVAPVEEPRVEPTVAPVQDNVGTVNLDKIADTPTSEPASDPVTPPVAPAPISAAPVAEAAAGGQSIIPFVFIGLILIGIGFIVYLIVTGHNIFGNDPITEDLPTDSTTTTTTTTENLTGSTTPTKTTEVTEKTTTPVDLTKEELINNIDNYTLYATLNMETQGINMTITMSGVVDQKNKSNAIRVTTAVSSYSVSYQTYIDGNTDYYYMQDPTNKNNWVKQKNTKEFFDIEGYIKKLNSYENVTKIEDGHYRVKVSKDQVIGMVTQTGVDTSLYVDGLEMDIYTKDGYITRIESDFTNAIKGADKLKMVYRLSKYDQSGDVVIPQTIIDSAKNA